MTRHPIIEQLMLEGLPEPLPQRRPIHPELFPKLPPPYDREGFVAELRRIGAQEGLDPDLLPALVHVESKGDPHARSSAGALGLVQFMPETAKERGVDPKSFGALKSAAQYLKGFQDPNRFKKYHDLDTALRRYNAGQGTVADWKLKGIPLTQEAREYPGKIRRALKLLQE